MQIVFVTITSNREVKKKNKKVIYSIVVGEIESAVQSGKV